MTNNECNQNNRVTVPLKEEDDDLCQILWLSVIMQGLSDALSSSNKYPFNKRREEALEWFAAKEGSDSDFAVICDMLGVDFKMAQKRINLFLTGKLPIIDFRCFRKGNLDAPPTESRKSFFKKAKEKELRGKFHRPISVISPEYFRKPPILSKAENDTVITHFEEAA